MHLIPAEAGISIVKWGKDSCFRRNEEGGRVEEMKILRVLSVSSVGIKIRVNPCSYS